MEVKPIKTEKTMNEVRKDLIVKGAEKLASFIGKSLNIKGVYTKSGKKSMFSFAAYSEGKLLGIYRALPSKKYGVITKKWSFTPQNLKTFKL